MPAVETRRHDAPSTPAEERVVLVGVAWSTFESLLADLCDSSVPRMTYDEGILELMTPYVEHESVNRTLALIVEVVAEEWQIDVLDAGSTTLLRQEQKRGIEPDSCFYIQHAAAVRGKTKRELSVDPPPDLAIEIEITRGAIPKLPVYAALGVPEVWRYDGARIHIVVLESGTYHARSHSLVFAKLSDAFITEWLARGRQMPRPDFLKDLRAWLRSTGRA